MFFALPSLILDALKGVAPYTHHHSRCAVWCLCRKRSAAAAFGVLPCAHSLTCLFPRPRSMATAFIFLNGATVIILGCATTLVSWFTINVSIVRDDMIQRWVEKARYVT